MVYRVGMKIKVNIIETERPPITVLAMGAQSSAPGPIPKAIGSKAKMVVTRISHIKLWTSQTLMIEWLQKPVSASSDGLVGGTQWVKKLRMH